MQGMSALLAMRCLSDSEPWGGCEEPTGGWSPFAPRERARREEVLVVERSTKRASQLTRLLRRRGYYVVWSESYGRTEAQLRRSGGEAIPYRVLVIGVEEGADEALSGLLAALSEPQHGRAWVVLVGGEDQAPVRRWLTGRPRSDLVPWEEHERVPALVERLLATGARPAPPEASRGKERPCRILLVDDAPTIRGQYRRLLERHGYGVVTAADGEEGFRKACDGGFDLALIDFYMPGGTGDALCRRLAADPRTRDLRTAIFTATYRDSVIRASLRAGASDCLFKDEAKELFLARIAAMSRSIQAQKLEEERRHRLEAILSSVGEGVFGVDPDGRITFLNAVGARILGHEDGPEALIGLMPHAAFHFALEDGSPIPLERCFLQGVYASGKELRGWETVFWHRTGRPITVECTVLPLTVQGRREGSVVAFRDLTERRRLDQQLSWMAAHDPLTGLGNRRHFEEQLGWEIDRLRGRDERSALLHLDLDHFSYINDTAGPAVGDKILREVAQRLRAVLRPADVVARLGGDELAAILNSVSLATARRMAEEVRAAVAEAQFAYEGQVYRIYASIGLERITRATSSPGEVLANAELACNVAKRKGRNQVHVYEPADDEKGALHSELQWSLQLREALRSDGFSLRFQPIVALQDLEAARAPAGGGGLWRKPGTAAGKEYYEVLLRLRNNGEAAISPREFLPIAERFNLMLDIDRWVTRHALEALAQLNREGRQATFSVNLSAHVLGADGLLPFLKRTMEELAIDPGSVIFEITESTAARNIDQARLFICELKELGCRFALDDFGTGFSSFVYLKNLPVDFIKIEQVFVQEMARSRVDRVMVEYINDMAHSLGRLTVAEGVEDAATLDLLRACGVDFVQGYLISQPLGELD